MANNYVSTCVEVELNSLENVKAAEEFYKLAEVFACENECNEELKPIVEGAGKEEWDDFLLSVSDNWNISFKLFPTERDTSITLGDQGYVNVEELASFIQFLQNRFGLEKAVFIAWSETCSNFRVNEFSGGAALVHKDHIEWQESPDMWFDRMCKGLNISY